MRFVVSLFLLSFMEQRLARSILTSTLVEHLLSGDDVNVRPDADGGPPVVVSIGVSITDLEERKERPGVYKVHGFVEMMWKNSRLSWNPADYGNITKVGLPANQIWLPDITLYNNMNAKERVFSEMAVRAVVTSSGEVTWAPPATLPVYCETNRTANATEISCRVILGSWTHDASSVDLKATSPTMNDDFLADYYRMLNSSVIKETVYYACCPEAYPKVTVSFTIGRLNI